MNSLENRAILLVAHGSRRPEANADLVQLAAMLNGRGYPLVEVSYLELAQPTIQEGGRACVAKGATSVWMMPYFLSAGVHVVQDLEEHRTALATEFPEVEFKLSPHLGLHPLMVDIVIDRLNNG